MKVNNASGIKSMSVEMPAETYRLLRIAAAEVDTNVSQLMRGIVDSFLSERYEGFEPQPMPSSKSSKASG